MSETIGDRLLIVRKAHEHSQSEMAKRLGVAQSTLSQFETGRSQVNTSVLLKLVEDFDVSADWLLTGRGARRIREVRDSKRVPLVDESTNFEGIAEGSFVDPIAMFDLPGFEGSSYAMFRVEEDSMMPTIFSGDYLIAERVEDIDELDDHTITVTVLEDDYLVSRVIDGGEASSSLYLRTDHPKHPPIEVDDEDVEHVWRVCGRLTETVDPYVRLAREDISRVESELADIRSILSPSRPVSVPGEE